VITQCCIRHLYAAKDDPAIDLAKTFERRRCGHHELPEPLSTLDCLKEVVDAKENQTNKHRYVIASQDIEVRSFMRKIPGVPLIYINRSVMIMEPMAEVTDDARLKEERSKFRAGLKSRLPQLLGKRDRDHEQHEEHEEHDKYGEHGEIDHPQPLQKKASRGSKEPNPLSMLKPKRRASTNQDSAPIEDPGSPPETGESSEVAEKTKRKRKPSKIKEHTLRAAEIITGRKNLQF
jgi:U3 small nucleolar RNA-associated protein 23